MLLQEAQIHSQGQLGLRQLLISQYLIFRRGEQCCEGDIHVADALISDARTVVLCLS